MTTPPTEAPATTPTADPVDPVDPADPTDLTDPTDAVADSAAHAAAHAAAPPADEPAQPPPAHRNRVRLTGRVSADPEERVLPSGDVLVTFRLVVDRPPVGRNAGPDGPAARRQVDVLDVACWTAEVRAAALALAAGEVVDVEGSLRRRFFAAGAGRASRYEVEAGRVRTARASRARSARSASSG